MHVRRKLVAGNWKMNGTRAALGEIAAIAAAARETAGVDVALCPPFTLIPLAAPRAGGVAIGGQDCHQSPSGAHTGNVSAAMLVEAGAKLVIVGHSERRADQHEEDSLVRAKAEAALAAGLQTIVCVGEVEEERIAGSHVDKVLYQLEHSLPELAREAELVVAYEPVWAIGTGRTATPADAAEMHAAIRAALVARFGDAGERIRILYGGSCNGANAAELFKVDQVDGGLVGGASLTAAQFVPIIEAAARS
ncbi:MAG: triose-phosphate isomerase [Alphaproteobacteria bacterium]|nr:triose-phosphate isomerase [Alphaproteobacteria bacterium]MBV9900140.1 triose-phosphate isomerase [Alphaproteobacteria bacterium]